MTPAEARVLIAEGARHEPHLTGSPSSIAYAAARRWIESNLVSLLAGYAEALDEIVGLKLGMPITELEAEVERLKSTLCPACEGRTERLYNDGMMHRCAVCKGTGRRP